MGKKILYVHGLGSGAGSRSAGLLDKHLKERTGETSGAELMNISARAATAGSIQ